MLELDIEITEGDEALYGVYGDADMARMRCYQIDALECVDDSWSEVERQYITLATGCGKTVIFAKVAEREVKKYQGRVLVLAHTDELINQGRDKIQKFTGIRAGKEKAHDHASRHDNIVVGSVASLCRPDRLKSWRPDHFTLIVVDECHRSLAKSYQMILNYFSAGGARVLGVTATPDRGDKKKLGEFYMKHSFDYNLLKACNDGYLVRPIVQQIPIKIDLTGVKSTRTTNGSDFDSREIAERMRPFIVEIAKEIATAAGDRKTVIFMPSIEASKIMADALCAQGLRGGYVSGECPDRAAKIADLRSGRITHMANAMLLTEGFDDDTISCVVVLRPTKIRAIYVQCVGRGTRPLDGILEGLETAEERRSAIAESSKPNMLILDFLWLAGKMNLIKPCDLVATTQEVRKQMEKRPEGDLLDIQEDAEKDALAALEKAVKKNSRKRRATLDPLSMAIQLDSQEIAQYRPANIWEKQPVTDAQAQILERNGIGRESVSCRGLASKIIDVLFQRADLGLATLKQVNFLKKQGYDEAEKLTRKEATALMGERLEYLKNRRK